METLITMVSIVETMEKNESDESKYLQYATDLKVKSIDTSNYEETGQITITTTSTYYDSAIFGEKWMELYFTIEYDLKIEKEDEDYLLDELRKYENISKATFFEIKTLGRKVYKYFNMDYMMNIKTHQREMDMTNYDDVNRIRNIYWKNVIDHDSMCDNLEHLHWRVHEDKCEKREYERNKEKYEKYKELSRKLLDEMSCDSSNDN